MLVPGIFAGYRGVAALARRLAPAHRVVAFDLRGRGRSPVEGPFGLAQHASDLWRAIDELALVQPLLCGHSLGAFAVATAVSARPGGLSGLVLLDGGLWSPRPVPVELVHAIFAADRTRLDRRFPDVEAYAADREIAPTAAVLDELAYELEPAGDLLTPVMPVAAFDDDVASIASHVGGNRPLASIGCPILVVRALRGIGGDPQAQMLPDITIEDARAAGVEFRLLDLAESTHGQLVREPHAGDVASEILAVER